MLKYFIFNLCLIFYTSLAYSDEEYTIDRLEWEKSFKKKAIVQIQNPYGNVYIKKSNDETLVFHAVAQNHTSRDNKAKLDVSKTSNGFINLKIKLDHDTLVEKERIDVAILVPKNVELVIEMKGDHFNAKKLNSPVKLVTQSTDIKISTNAHFDIFTKSGEIDLTITNNSNLQTSKAQSHSGDITIHYRKSKPYFNILSGQLVASNSAQLLLSKIKKGRNKYFNTPDISSTINITSDSGRITLIDNLIQ